MITFVVVVLRDPESIFKPQTRSPCDTVEGERFTTLKRLRPSLPHGLERLRVQWNRRAALRTRDLALRLKLAKPLAERVVAARARHRKLRIAQQIDHRKASGEIAAA
jgi:hypothetical protein